MNDNARKMIDIWLATGIANNDMSLIRAALRLFRGDEDMAAMADTIYGPQDK